MNADALSDLVLAMVCVALAAANWRTRPALAQACGMIGLAAGFGVLRYFEIDFALGPHRFFSLLAAGAAYPLAAVAMRWPDGDVGRRANAALRFGLLFAALAVALHLSGLTFWRQLVPVISVLMIVVTAIRLKKSRPIFGSLLLVFSLLVAGFGQAPDFVIGPLNAIQAMHYLMAAGFALLAWPLKLTKRP